MRKTTYFENGKTKLTLNFCEILLSLKTEGSKRYLSVRVMASAGGILTVCHQLLYTYVNRCLYIQSMSATQNLLLFCVRDLK